MILIYFIFLYFIFNVLHGTVRAHMWGVCYTHVAVCSQPYTIYKNVRNDGALYIKFNLSSVSGTINAFISC